MLFSAKRRRGEPNSCFHSLANLIVLRREDIFCKAVWLPRWVVFRRWSTKWARTIVVRGIWASSFLAHATLVAAEKGFERNVPQGLKPFHIFGHCGTTKQLGEKGSESLRNARNHPAAAKAALISGHLAARINSCPFKATSRGDYSPSCEVVPFQSNKSRGLFTKL